MSAAVSHTIVLTDTTARIWKDSFELRPADLGLKGAWSIRKSTLRGGVIGGVDIVEIDNGALTLTIVPTRGMGVWRGAYKGIGLGWRSPVQGPVHPSLIDLYERGGLGWLRGFDELIVRCGLESNGAPCRDTVTNNMGQPATVDLTLHGRIANTAASYVAIEISGTTPSRLTVCGTVLEAGLFLPQLELQTRISTVEGSNAFSVDDTIANRKAVECEMELLYHNNFGPPLLDGGAKLEIAARMVAPRDARAAEGVDTYDTYLPPTSGYTEQCYWYETIGDDRGETVMMLRNKSADKGVALRYNRTQLPCFTQWKNTASDECGYVTGLEPGTNFPNPKPFERANNRVVRLAPGATHTARQVFEILDSAAAVESVRREIAAIQVSADRIVHRAPIAGYSDV